MSLSAMCILDLIYLVTIVVKKWPLLKSAGDFNISLDKLNERGKDKNISVWMIQKLATNSKIYISGVKTV